MPFVTGKTWTTDGLYRETRGKVDRRVAEGCLTVEMEAAAFFAVAAFRGVSFGQLLYAGDDLSGDAGLCVPENRFMPRTPASVAPARIREAVTAPRVPRPDAKAMEATVTPSGTLWRNTAQKTRRPKGTDTRNPEAIDTPSKKVWVARPTRAEKPARVAASVRGGAGPARRADARACERLVAALTAAVAAALVELAARFSEDEKALARAPRR